MAEPLSQPPHWCRLFEAMLEVVIDSLMSAADKEEAADWTLELVQSKTTDFGSAERHSRREQSHIRSPGEAPVDADNRFDFHDSPAMLAMKVAPGE